MPPKSSRCSPSHASPLASLWRVRKFAFGNYWICKSLRSETERPCRPTSPVRAGCRRGQIAPRQSPGEPCCRRSAAEDTALASKVIAQRGPSPPLHACRTDGTCWRAPLAALTNAVAASYTSRGPNTSTPTSTTSRFVVSESAGQRAGSGAASTVHTRSACGGTSS